ncbi:hypothetical protein BDR07DRAFT_1374021 [Suillus spraguei]|nr:hypothetical protein BDR07DRAFT_1374021 [Suillus spraguei]
MSHSSTSTYDIGNITIWDVTNVLEFATSRFISIWMMPAYKASFVRYMKWKANHFVFPYINLCMVLNTHPTMPDLLCSIISKFARLQTRHINTKQFHDEFFMHCSPHDPELRSTHRVVTNYAHDWWKDCFDTLQFPLPFLDINEVMDMTQDHFEQLPMGAILVPGPVVTSQVEGDPLLNQILAVKARIQHLGESLASLLEEKTKAAASNMADLKGPMDQLEEALLKSGSITKCDLVTSDFVQQLFDCNVAGNQQSILPPLEIDVPTMLACQQLAQVLTDAYTNPSTMNPLINNLMGGLQNMT